jgi:dTMP kinase
VDDGILGISTGGLSPFKGTGELKGTLISLEGCEGSGKSTQADMLKGYLEERGKEVTLVREPGGTDIGERIRELLLDPGAGEMAPITEALLFASARAQLVRDVIRPALRAGNVVIADRYTDSSLAYQGVARGCGLEAVKNLNDWATGDLEPNLTVFLDMAVKDGLARARGADRIEGEELAFHENVRYAYSMLIRIFSYRMVVVDARGTPEDVHDRVVSHISRMVI